MHIYSRAHRDVRMFCQHFYLCEAHMHENKRGVQIAVPRFVSHADYTSLWILAYVDGTFGLWLGSMGFHTRSSHMRAPCRSTIYKRMYLGNHLVSREHAGSMVIAAMCVPSSAARGGCVAIFQLEDHLMEDSMKVPFFGFRVIPPWFLGAEIVLICPARGVRFFHF